MADLDIRISKVLNFLLAEAHLTPSELSRRTNLPQSTVDRLVNAKTPDPRASTLEPIANYFGISVDQLIGKKPLSKFDVSSAEQVTTGKAVPLINWEELARHSQLTPTLTPSNWFAWITANTEVGEQGFAVKLKGLAMSPRFPEGSIIIVNPSCKPEDRDYVLIEYHNAIYYRQLILEGREQYLRALNPDYETLKLKEPYRFIGVVTESRIITKNFQHNL